MLIVFLAIGILHLVSLKLFRLPEKRKAKFRKVFYYLYGVVFLAQGIVRMLETQRLNVLSLGICVFGLLIIVLNFKGKIHSEKPK